MLVLLFNQNAAITGSISIAGQGAIVANQTLYISGAVSIAGRGAVIANQTVYIFGAIAISGISSVTEVGVQAAICSIAGVGSVTLAAPTIYVNGGSSWTRVQIASEETDSTHSSVLTVNSTLAGSLLVAIVIYDTVSGITITDNQSNTWTYVETQSDGGVDHTVDLWYCIGAIAGVTTITATQVGTGTIQTSRVTVAEYTPPPGATISLDGFAHSITPCDPNVLGYIPIQGTTSTGNITGTASNSLIVAGGVVANYQGVVSSPMTPRLIGGSLVGSFTGGTNEPYADAINQPSGAYNPNFQFGYDGHFDYNVLLVGAIFKAASAGTFAGHASVVVQGLATGQITIAGVGSVVNRGIATSSISISGTGLLIIQGLATSPITVAGLGAVVAAGTSTVGTLAVAGLASVIATGMIPGVIVVTGLGTVVATGTSTIGAVSIVGFATVITAGMIPGDITIAGLATIVALGTSTIGAVTIAGVSTVVAVGMIPGDITIAGLGAVIAVGTSTVGVIVVAGLGASSIAGLSAALAVCLIDGTSSVVEDYTNYIPGLIACTGQATVEIGQIEYVPGSVDVIGTSSVTFNGLSAIFASSEADGAGAFVATGVSEDLDSCSVDGISTVSFSALSAVIATAEADGVGSVTLAQPSVSNLTSVICPGAATLTLNAVSYAIGTFISGGVAQVNATGRAALISTCSINGNSSLSLNGTAAVLANVETEGLGSVTLDGVSAVLETCTIASVGTASFKGTVVFFGNATVNGSAIVVANSTVLVPANEVAQGSALVSFNETCFVSGAVNVTGSVSVQTDGWAVHAFASVSVVCSSNISLAIRNNIDDSITLSGSAILTFNGLSAVFGTETVSASASLLAAGTSTLGHEIISAKATVALSATVYVPGQITISCSSVVFDFSISAQIATIAIQGSASVIPLRSLFVPETAAGVATVTATGTAITSANISGHGAVTLATATSSSLQSAGVAELSLTATALLPGEVVCTAASSVVWIGSIYLIETVVVNGAATVDTDGNAIASTILTAGLSDLDFSAIALSTCSINGQASFDVNAVSYCTGSILCTGTAQVDLEGIVVAVIVIAGISSAEILPFYSADSDGLATVRFHAVVAIPTTPTPGRIAIVRKANRTVAVRKTNRTVVVQAQVQEASRSVKVQESNRSVAVVAHSRRIIAAAAHSQIILVNVINRKIIVPQIPRLIKVYPVSRVIEIPK